MCRPVSQNTPSALSLSPFSIHLVTLSFIHTHTHKLRVQTKSQQSAGHNRHSSSCRYYHTCLIICVQSSRQTCGEIFEGFVVPRAQFTLIGEFVYSLSSPANPPQPVTHTFQGTGADFQTALSRISRAEWHERKTDGLQLSGFSPSNASKEILTNLCLPLHFPLYSSTLCVFHFLLYPLSPPLSLLSVPLTGRCWQQFSPSGPFWQPGQGPGSYQKWHRYKYSQSGERAAHSPDWIILEVIASDWQAHLTTSQWFLFIPFLDSYSRQAVLLICKSDLQLYCVTVQKQKYFSIYVPSMAHSRILPGLLSPCLLFTY